MFKVTAPQLRVHWCSDIAVAEKVSEDLSRRFKCDCQISEIAEKKTWYSQKTYPFWCEDIESLEFPINSEITINCSRSEITQAVRSASGSLAQIVSSDIFCFLINDAFWQQQYRHDNTSCRNK